VQDVAGGAPRRLVEGAAAGAVSPDGRIVASMGAAGAVFVRALERLGDLFRDRNLHPARSEVVEQICVLESER